MSKLFRLVLDKERFKVLLSNIHELQPGATRKDIGELFRYFGLEEIVQQEDKIPEVLPKGLSKEKIDVMASMNAVFLSYPYVKVEMPTREHIGFAADYLYKLMQGEYVDLMESSYATVRLSRSQEENLYFAIEAYFSITKEDESFLYQNIIHQSHGKIVQLRKKLIECIESKLTYFTQKNTTQRIVNVLTDCDPRNLESFCALSDFDDWEIINKSIIPEAVRYAKKQWEIKDF